MIFRAVQYDTAVCTLQYDIPRHSLRHTSPFDTIFARHSLPYLRIFCSRLLLLSLPSARSRRGTIVCHLQFNKADSKANSSANATQDKEAHNNATYTDSTFLAELQEPILGGRRLGRVGVFPPRRRRGRRVSLCQHSEKVHVVLAVNSSLDGVRFRYHSLPASLS